MKVGACLLSGVIWETGLDADQSTGVEALAGRFRLKALLLFVV
jgi:hypothetical protein